MAHQVDVPEYVSRCLKSMAKYQSGMKLSSKDSKAEYIHQNEVPSLCVLPYLRLNVWMSIGEAVDYS